MEMILFMGIQGSGKSTFYIQRFYHTHVRVNGDMLGTKRREQLLIQACLEGGQPFVVDKVNGTRDARAPYLHLARTAGFRAVGYFFDTDVKAAIERNHQRTGKARVPVPAIYGAAKRFELPAKSEGFQDLFTVRIVGEHEFSVEPRAE